MLIGPFSSWWGSDFPRNDLACNKGTLAGDRRLQGGTLVASWIIVGLESGSTLPPGPAPDLYHPVVVGMSNGNIRVAFHSGGFIARRSLGETQWQRTESSHLLSAPSSNCFLSKDLPFLWLHVHEFLVSESAVWVKYFPGYILWPFKLLSNPKYIS